MHGGNQHRSFFFIQANDYLTQYYNTLPDHTSTPEEDAAGLSGLSKDFGFAATLFDTSEAMSINPEVFCNDWSARDFHHLVRYRAWKSHVQNEYSKIMTAKHASK